MRPRCASSEFLRQPRCKPSRWERAIADPYFRNPTGDYAARLIEASGLKGERVGSAVVSEKHANFIINTGGATAADVESLIERVASRVAA